MAPLVRFPGGPITPHGAYHVLRGRIPQVALRSYDDTVVFNMMGGLAIADKVMLPGRVEVKGLKGLMAPWRIIDQKGATEDGTTFVTALYDPVEAQIDVRVVGKDPEDCRRVARYLMDSLDVFETSEFSWFTPAMGRWWANARWSGPPADMVAGIHTRTQDLSLRVRVDNAFWESYPCVDSFGFSYSTGTVDLSTDTSDLTDQFDVLASGAGSGTLSISDGEILPTMTGDRTIVTRLKDYTSATDYQVNSIKIGTTGTWFYPIDAADIIICRENNTGTVGTDGVYLTIYRHLLKLSYFVGGTETILRQQLLIVPPIQGETFTLICGDPGDGTNAAIPRKYIVQRDGATLMTVIESGTGSPLDSSHRSQGLGAISTTAARPASIRGFNVGDNAIAEQDDFITAVNAGDQPMWQNFTCFGPGTFKLWNGPGAGANEYVTLGPLLNNQVMQVRTNPGKRGVVDMTSTPASPQALNAFQQAIKDFESFLLISNTQFATEVNTSIFGITTPQGNPYSLMKGRFSVPIPPKSPGQPAQRYRVKVGITGGNAQSRIIAAGTPYRRNPL